MTEGEVAVVDMAELSGAPSNELPWGGAFRVSARGTERGPVLPVVTGAVGAGKQYWL